jgi:hypothetical protein
MAPLNSDVLIVAVMLRSIAELASNNSLQLTIDPPPAIASAELGVVSNTAELKR